MTDSVPAFQGKARPKEEILSAFTDQCRSLIILRMLFGGLLGRVSFVPWALQHDPTRLSPVENVVPAFLLLSGMGFRSAFLRGMHRGGIAVLRRLFMPDMHPFCKMSLSFWTGGGSSSASEDAHDAAIS